MPLSIAHGNGIKNFRAVTKIDALIWGAQAAKAKSRMPSGEQSTARQAAPKAQPALNLTRSDDKKGARWRTSGRAILILLVAD